MNKHDLRADHYLERKRLANDRESPAVKEEWPSTRSDPPIPPWFPMRSLGASSGSSPVLSAAGGHCRRCGSLVRFWIVPGHAADWGILAADVLHDMRNTRMNPTLGGLLDVSVLSRNVSGMYPE